MAIDKPRERPTVPDVLPLLQAMYQRHCGGCCLHIVTDDDNVEDDHMRWALDYARAQGHPDCIAAAEMLAQMTATQRLKAARRKRHSV